jgi:hypothetical protein
VKQAIRQRIVDETGYPVAWGLLQDGASLPRVAIYQISGSADYAMSGPTGLREARIQVDVYGTSYGQMETAAQAVTTALSGWVSGAVRAVFLVGQRDEAPDADDKLFRASLDFIVHYQES